MERAGLRCPRNGQAEVWCMEVRDATSVKQPLDALSVSGKATQAICQPGYRPTR